MVSLVNKNKRIQTTQYAYVTIYSDHIICITCNLDFSGGLIPNKELRYKLILLEDTASEIFFQ